MTLTTRQTIIAGGAVALALAASFAAGRYSTPERTTSTSAVEERAWGDATRHTSRTEQAEASSASASVTRRRVTTRTERAPDGGQVTTRVEDTETRSGSVASSSSLTVDDEVAREASGSTRLATTSQVVEGARPGWRVDLSAEWDARAPSFQPRRYGVGLARRFIGTAWIGATVSTAVDDPRAVEAGLVVSLEF